MAQIPVQGEVPAGDCVSKHICEVPPLTPHANEVSDAFTNVAVCHRAEP
jgi:hypothetical protein